MVWMIALASFIDQYKSMRYILSPTDLTEATMDPRQLNIIFRFLNFLGLHKAAALAMLVIDNKIQMDMIRVNPQLESAITYLNQREAAKSAPSFMFNYGNEDELQVFERLKNQYQLGTLTDENAYEIRINNNNNEFR